MESNMNDITPPSIICRRLGPSDADDYRTLRLFCLRTSPEAFGSIYEEEVRKPKLAYERFIEDADPDHFIFGAFDGAQLIGIVGFARGDRTKTRHRGEIVQVFVHPDHRRQGVGEKLMCAVIAAAFAQEGVDQLELGAMADNHAAIQLYEALGFRTFGVHPSYFKVGGQSWDQQLMQLLKRDLSERPISKG